jgi:single-stranded DNA-binding protein
VAVAGRLAYSEWEDGDGRRRSKHEVIARQIDFLGGGRAETEDAAASP